MSNRKPRPSAWRCYIVAEQIRDGKRTVSEIATALRLSTANIQDVVMTLQVRGHVTRAYHAGHKTHWYEYALITMPPHAEPPARYLERDTPETFGPNPLRPLLDALGWRETVPTGTPGKTHRLDT